MLYFPAALDYTGWERGSIMRSTTNEQAWDTSKQFDMLHLRYPAKIHFKQMKKYIYILYYIYIYTKTTSLANFSWVVYISRCMGQKKNIYKPRVKPAFVAEK